MKTLNSFTNASNDIVLTINYSTVKVEYFENGMLWSSISINNMEPFAFSNAEAYALANMLEHVYPKGAWQLLADWLFMMNNNIPFTCHHNIDDMGVAIRRLYNKRMNYGILMTHNQRAQLAHTMRAINEALSLEDRRVYHKHNGRRR